MLRRVVAAAAVAIVLTSIACSTVDATDPEAAITGTCITAGGYCLTQNGPGAKGQGPRDCEQAGEIFRDLEIAAPALSCSRGQCCLELTGHAATSTAIGFVAVGCESADAGADAGLHDASADADADGAPLTESHGGLRGTPPAACGATPTAFVPADRAALEQALAGAWVQCPAGDARALPSAEDAVGFVVGEFLEHADTNESDAPISLLAEDAACRFSLRTSDSSWLGNVSVTAASTNIRFHAPNYDDTTTAHVLVSTSPRMLVVENFGVFVAVE